MKQHIKNPKRVAGAKKAWTLMRSRTWQRANADSVITERLRAKAKLNGKKSRK
jgi:hypothetical protein